MEPVPALKPIVPLVFDVLFPPVTLTSPLLFIVPVSFVINPIEPFEFTLTIPVAVLFPVPVPAAYIPIFSPFVTLIFLLLTTVPVLV